MKSFIVLLPTILFVLAFIVTLIFNKKSGTNELFIERFTQEDQTTVTKTSTSRFVLFLTGLTALILGVGLVTYFLYASLHGLTFSNENLESILKVILYLGIGVVPYGANQLKNLF